MSGRTADLAWRWLRLGAALGAGAGAGALMGGGLEGVEEAASATLSVSAILSGLSAALLLRRWYPRPEEPAPAGIAAVGILLGCYLVVGRLLWEQRNAHDLAAYGAVGLIVAWLLFTSTAEAPLLGAFILGGLLGGTLALSGPAVEPEAFAFILEAGEGRHAPRLYAALGLGGAYSAALGAVAARLSRWGVEGPLERAWTVDEEGRVTLPR